MNNFPLEQIADVDQRHANLRLYWHESRRSPLRVAVSINQHRAAQLLGVSPANLYRSGGEVGLDDEDALAELDPRIREVAEAAFTTGAVYQLQEGRWRIAKTAISAARINNLANKSPAPREARKPNVRLPVRVLKLTVIEERDFRRAGAVAWLRRELDALPTPPPYCSDKSRAPKTKGGRTPISIRMSDAHWSLLLSVGGIRWLRERLAVTALN